MKQFYIDKPYSEMTRREKREYKRWMHKNNRWDGAVVIENLKREGRLNVQGDLTPPSGDK